MADLTAGDPGVIRPLLIAGPTASGKSDYALRQAAKGGVIINADASQVYEGWRLLTARPSEEEMAQAPHRLYGHVPPSVRYSVGAWLRDMSAMLESVRAEGLRPIIVGGTGLYFKALTEGLANIPEPPETIRAAVDARLKGEGVEALAADLTRRDPATADATDLLNPMRVTRALEVLEATGKGLADWRAETPPPLVTEAEKILIRPDRDALYARCDLRFDRIETGSLRTDHHNLRFDGFGCNRHACYQTTAADRHNNHIQIRLLFQNLQRDCALPGSHNRIIKRVNKGHPPLGRQIQRELDAFVKSRTMQDHLGPEILGFLDLVERCPFGHDDHGWNAQPVCVIRKSLCVVASTTSDHTSFLFRLRQCQQLRQRAPRFEGVSVLQVFKLEIEIEP